MCQYSESLYNSENQYFSNESYVMLKSIHVEKIPSNVQENLIHFNVTKDRKFINGF